MSGQPLIHPTDASKFREQYLAELAQQIANDDRNLQANKIYKKTGQTPSIVLDTRTSGEKLADKQRLKIEIRSGLVEIMDGSTAERVVQELDDDALEFLAQRLPEIVSILKPKYKYGIPLVNFMTFMMEYIKATRESGDYIIGNQATVGKQVLMGIRQILGEMVNKDTLRQVAEALDQNISSVNIQVGNAIKRDLTELASVIPTKYELEMMLRSNNPLLTREIQKQLNDALQELPTTRQIQDIIVSLNTATRLRDAKRQEELLLKLHQILAMKPEVLQQIQLIRNEIGENQQETSLQIEYLKKTVTDRLDENDELSQGRSQQTIARITDKITQELQEQLAVNSNMTKAEIKDFIDEKLAEQTGTLQAGSERRRAEEAQLRRLGETLSTEQKIKLGEAKRTPTQIGSIEEKRIYAKDMIKLVKGQQTQKEIFNDVVGVEGVANMSNVQLDQVIDEINKRIDILASAYSRPANPLSASGNGLKKGRGMKGGSIIDDIDPAGVLTNVSRYIPFGRHKINTKKLKDNIIAVKKMTGCNIDGFPLRRVSNDLGSVMRTIIGGGQPEFRQLEKLSDEEKVYLNNLVKKSKIEDRLNLIAPSKDEDEKEIHQFEVMKGEILSGNDNVEHVKKFKLLIMKLIRKELLPKSQGKDLLLDLATLGY